MGLIGGRGGGLVTTSSFLTSAAAYRGPVRAQEGRWSSAITQRSKGRKPRKTPFRAVGNVDNNSDGFGMAISTPFDSDDAETTDGAFSLTRTDTLLLMEIDPADAREFVICCAARFVVRLAQRRDLSLFNSETVFGTGGRRSGLRAKRIAPE